MPAGQRRRAERFAGQHDAHMYVRVRSPWHPGLDRYWWRINRLHPDRAGDPVAHLWRGTRQAGIQRDVFPVCELVARSRFRFRMADGELSLPAGEAVPGA